MQAAGDGTTPPPTGTGAAAMLAKMGLGINQERFTATGHAEARTAAYYQRYRNMGISWVRFFIPAGFEGWMVPLSSNASAISGWLDAVQACVESGMRVTHIDACDVIGSWQVYTQSNEVKTGVRQDRMGALDGYIQRFAAAFAARNFPADRVIVGAINECGAGRNPDWQPERFRWNQHLRDALPNHTIVEGPCLWKDPRALYDPDYIPWEGQPSPGVFTPWNDPNTLIDVHHYLGWDTSGMIWLCDQCLTWGQNNNRGIIGGEWGFNWGNNPNYDYAAQSEMGTWISRFDDQSKYASFAQIRPNLWAVTDGSAWRINHVGNNTMPSNMSRAVTRWAGRVNTRLNITA